MSIKHLISSALVLVFCSFGIVLSAQNKVSGNIKDGETGESLIGVNIIIKNSVLGTTTDLDGNYDLDISEPLPYTLIFSMIGFETMEKVVNEANAIVDLSLETKSFIANEVVISASRVEERIMQSPVSIEKLDLLSIKNSTSSDFYDEVVKLKGVTNNMASLTFNTINTRGFGGGGNTRFVQLQDGMDNAAPLLNFPTGNVVGISELDIRSVELVPGAASALYGPNAFNGILIMQSKDPFQYQGLSATFKTGFIEGTNYTEPLYSGAIRYAKAFNDKFAFKINFSGLWANDWRAQNYTDDRNLVALAVTNPGINTSGNSSQALFDGLNTYGDESLIPVAGGLRRTGWKEQDLLESNKAQSFKYDAALHYKLSNKVQTSVSYKFGSGSTVYQGSERYALRNFSQQFAKWEINGSNWDLKAYGSFTGAGDSYNLTALGAYTNENVWPSIYNSNFAIPVGGGQVVNVPLRGGWAVAANIAANLPGYDANAAKAFADAGGFSTVPDAQKEGVAQQLAAGSTFIALPAGLRILAARELIKLASGPARPAVGSPEFNRIVHLVRDSLLFQKGGAGFIDNSHMYHVEGSYNLGSLFNDAVSWQVGGNFRRYDLFSDGTVFNEDPDGDGVNERIKIDEFGLYTQISKTFADKLKLTGSLRFDKNQNFNGQVSPRVSLVYSAGANKEHNIRASFQTGFRNPTSQGQFIFFPTTSILLGSTKRNAEAFGLHNGGAYTKESYDLYLAALQGAGIGGADAAKAKLVSIDFDYIQPEQLKSFELGYRGAINKKANIDISGFYNIYNNFIDQIFVVNKNKTAAKAEAFGSADPLTGTIVTTFYPYINVPAKLSAYGINAGLDYALAKNWKLSPNFSYNKANKAAATDLPGFANYDPGFNMPLYMTNVSLTNRKIVKNLAGTISWRWQDGYFFKNSFGSGNVPSYNTLDLQLNYFVPSIKSAIKIGVSNILNKAYITNIGNPNIGRMSYVSFTYDQFAK